MPPSSDQDINTTSSSDSKPNKLSQRPSAELQIPTKNGRKNGTARDSGGGGVASVTKNAFKMSNAKTSMQPARLQSTEMDPVSSQPSGNPITSPLLDALSFASLDRSASQNTNEWAKNVPAFSSSPSNLINLGESPPVLPYEDRLSHFMKEQRGIPNGHFSSASPPTNRRRPLSYQLDGNFPQSFDDHRSQMNYNPRRSSMYSQQSRFPQYPPLPHQAQAHFYSAPDPNFLLSPPAPGLVPGEKGYHCGFDRMSSENVVVAGYEGGVNIYSVSKRGLNKVSSIEGLRGGVCNAKILPWNVHSKGARQQPLIALVIHGPVWTSSETSSHGGGTPPSEAGSVLQSGSVRGSPNVHGQGNNDTEPIEYYQTTIELYSLSTKQHIQTLLSVPKVHIAMPTSSPSFRVPPPVGSLTIRADSGTIVVASGTTGETWLYHQVEVGRGLPKFRCIGKVWTTVQHGVTAEPLVPNGFSDGDWHSNDHTPVRKQYKASILSLSGRWLAFCPPAPSSQVSLRAEVPGLEVTKRVPGLNGHAPPQLPAVNCGVEMPDGESVMKQLVQIGTQKFIEAGNYLAQQGVSAWNNYRNKPSAVQPSAPPYQNHQIVGQQFPPTHGLSAPAPLVTKDPGLISIIDLNFLAQYSSSTGSAPHPLATFRVPHGCSFLSFAPNGLALFTASNKGDVQFVWDLMRIQYAKSSYLKGSPQGPNVQGPHVRQIAQFSRMTVARIVDVVWTSPHGERAAMVTEPGTVHVLDLPASAFTWPPPRRRTPHQKPEDNNDIGKSALTPSAVASSAVSSLWTAARPLVRGRRRSSVGISARTVTAQAGHGTQALAAGISRSVGAATGKMNEMRKAVNAKLHLPRSSVVPTRACIMLLNGKRNDLVVVVGSGIVGIYTIKNRRADRPADKQKASRGAKYVEHRIPSLPDVRLAQDFSRELNHIGDLELTERDVEESRWKARQPPPPGAQSHGTESSIPQAEIESNAPYQPFHTDRRVGLYTYCHEETLPPSLSVSTLISPQPKVDQKRLALSNSPKSSWVFGGPIKSTKLDVGPPHNPDDDFDFSADHRALPSSTIERVMRVTDSLEDMEQIVITTRRRRGVPRSGIENSEDADEEGFFEDDCEVLDFASQRV